MFTHALERSLHVSPPMAAERLVKSTSLKNFLSSWCCLDQQFSSTIFHHKQSVKHGAEVIALTWPSRPSSSHDAPHYDWHHGREACDTLPL